MPASAGRGDGLTTASKITIQETLDLLDGPFAAVAKGIGEGSYTLWLGSGISRDRVIGLDGVLAKLIEFLRINVTPHPDCAHRRALEKLFRMSGLPAADMAGIDLGQSAASWPVLKALVAALWNQYSAVLSIEVGDRKLDYLLWDGLDFPNTFASQDADAEHLAIGMLSLEGAFSLLASANWDGLLEAGVRELGHPETYRVTVTGEDLRSPAAAVATLYKFHGCAIRAISHENPYRRLLIARTSQITSWMTNDDFKIARDQLGAMLQVQRTLMVGMSAQDENIRHTFANANAHKGWQWDAAPTPVLFSAQELGDDHRNLLQNVYGEITYETHRAAICQAARIQAYAKPLLIALLLQVVSSKLKVLANDVTAPGLDGVARNSIVSGISFLRSRAASGGDVDRLAYVKQLAATLARAMHQHHAGVSAKGPQRYFPIDSDPVLRLKDKLIHQGSGMREAAAALGLIGFEESSHAWRTSTDDPLDARSGALRLTSTTGSARVFLAANDDAITGLLECEAFEDSDADVVVICSGRVTARQSRSPSGHRRTGVATARYVGLREMLRDARDLDDLRERFRQEVAL
ncbi:hypothetical protein ASF43_05695 [Pseudorhodoferax sp. Leaf267]|nr:hypothetical protein ASF43_05695 [Pseudorhodoferax sp. Leaf267]